MKTAIIFCEGIKQINFTPENDNERMALKLISPDDDIELAIKSGSMYNEREAWSPTIATTRGGYLRAFDGKDAIMLVLTPKSEAKPQQGNMLGLMTELYDLSHTVDCDKFIVQANELYKIEKR